jgi:hypothetical protein
MSNSIFVPIHRLPVEIDEVRKAIDRAFAEFNLARPDVQIHQLDDQHKPL